jgi:hydroxyacylglutathione hydrolase
MLIKHFLSLLIVAAAPAMSQSLQTGILPREWRTGGPNCLTIPDWQVHEYNPDLYILRESGCSHYEKPFLYLIFGKEKALLQDTGAGKTEVQLVVKRLIDQRAAARKEAPVPLLVVHSHSHGDHTSGDAKFASLPNTTVIPAQVDGTKKAIGITNWPEELGRIDLGGRVLNAIPIPGHDVVDLALYDAQTGLLFTGDTVYPGRLYVRDFPQYIASIGRLVEFTRDKPVAHILGTHIEQSRTPFVDYKVETRYQPDEHALELTRGDLLELHAALLRIKDAPVTLPLANLTITPRRPAPQPHP